MADGSSLPPYSPKSLLASKIFPGATAKEIDDLFIDATGIGGVRDEINKVYADIKVINDSIVNMLGELSKRKQVIMLPDITIPPASLLTGTMMEKTIVADCVGLSMTDQLEVIPKSMPTNYGLRGYTVPQAGKISIRLQCPLLLSGGSPIVFGVTAFR